jgi:hypothetical protein
VSFTASRTGPSDAFGCVGIVMGAMPAGATGGCRLVHLTTHDAHFPVRRRTPREGGVSGAARSDWGRLSHRHPGVRADRQSDPQLGKTANTRAGYLDQCVPRGSGRGNTLRGGRLSRYRLLSQHGSSFRRDGDSDTGNDHVGPGFGGGSSTGGCSTDGGAPNSFAERVGIGTANSSSSSTVSSGAFAYSASRISATR